jgi:hypothetical protein
MAVESALSEELVADLAVGGAQTVAIDGNGHVLGGD